MFYVSIVYDALPGEARGTLWIACEGEGKDEDSSLIWMEPWDRVPGDELRDECRYSIERGSVNIRQLTPEEASLLLAVSKGDRLTVLENRDWMEDGLTVDVGNRVTLRGLDWLAMNATGVIRYKGHVEGRMGVWFGIEADAQMSGRGTSDGSINDKRYFTCAPLDGIFVSLVNLRRTPIKGPQSLTGSDELDAGKTALLPEERVVWFSDTGPEKATVKWVGRLPGATDTDVYAGVEFDNPVGSGSGKYRKRELFQSRRGHAALVPVLGLMKASDVDASTPGVTSECVANNPEMKHPDNSAAGNGERWHVDIGTEVKISRPPNPKAWLTRGASAVVEDVSLDPPGKRFPSVGTRVEVLHDPVRRGTVRWLGLLERVGNDLVAGLEMDDEDIACYTDGTCLGTRLFDCPSHRALFVRATSCRPLGVASHMNRLC